MIKKPHVKNLSRNISSILLKKFRQSKSIRTHGIVCLNKFQIGQVNSWLLKYAWEWDPHLSPTELRCLRMLSICLHCCERVASKPKRRTINNLSPTFTPGYQYISMNYIMHCHLIADGSAFKYLFNCLGTIPKIIKYILSRKRWTKEIELYIHKYSNSSALCIGTFLFHNSSRRWASHYSSRPTYHPQNNDKLIFWRIKTKICTFPCKFYSRPSRDVDPTPPVYAQFCEYIRRMYAWGL